MARASVPTKLPLDEWAKIFGVNPLHFNQIVIEDTPNATCDQGWFQYDWQDNARVSREQVARAIRSAESQIERIIGYNLLPAWTVDEWRPTARPYRRELVNFSGSDIRGYRWGVAANKAYFISGGVRAFSAIPASDVTWVDHDGDDYQEVGTVELSDLDAAVPACELRAYYPGHGGEDAWEIKPLISAVNNGDGTGTVSFRRELAVLAAEQERYPVSVEVRPQAIDGFNDAKFLESVAVGRLYNDPSQQVTFMWEKLANCMSCSDGSCSECQYTTATGCLHLKSEPRLSFVALTPAVWDADALVFSPANFCVNRAPDVARLYYRSGWRAPDAACPTATMDREFARLVAILAAAQLDRNVCDCKNIEESIGRWRRDLAFTGGAEELSTYGLAPTDLNNPIGTRYGEVYVWRELSRMPDLVVGRGVETHV